MVTLSSVAVFTDDRDASAALEVFFRLMEIDCVILREDAGGVGAIRGAAPDALIVDLALAEALVAGSDAPLPPLLLLADGEAESDLGPVLPKPAGRFEDLLRILEAVLARQG
jgi:hypothetical protein